MGRQATSAPLAAMVVDMMVDRLALSSKWTVDLALPSGHHSLEVSSGCVYWRQVHDFGAGWPVFARRLSEEDADWTNLRAMLSELYEIVLRPSRLRSFSADLAATCCARSFTASAR